MYNGRSFPITVKHSDTVLNLRELINDCEGTPNSPYVLTHGGVTFDSDSARVIDVLHARAVSVTLDLKGGSGKWMGSRHIQGIDRVKDHEEHPHESKFDADGVYVPPVMVVV